MDEGKILLLDLGRSDGETNRLIGRVDAEAVKRDPKTETQHELFSSLSEQWEQWVDRLHLQPAHPLPWPQVSNRRLHHDRAQSRPFQYPLHLQHL